ncbi:MAG: PDZ domain-containing protein [Acidobacteriota bacterium]|nr:PDZ domain-containing protein [Acidobacteriota bacterium]
MHYLKSALIFLGAAMLCPAQMTPDQKMIDLFQLSSTYALNYGPAQWKRDAFKYDLLDLSGWLDKAAKSKDDLDYYEVLVAYVASLNDAHDLFALPSDFEAYLGFSVDIYDGKVLVDYAGANANGVPFPVIGDELVSIDGASVADLMQSFANYAVAANPLSSGRVAAALLTDRIQAYMPHAHMVPDVSTVVIRHADGSTDALSLAGPRPERR